MGFLTGTLKPYLIGGAVAGMALFLLAFYLRGVELDACNATLDQIRADGEQAIKDGQEAARRIQEQREKDNRAHERLIREIKHAPQTHNAPLAPVLADALARLCNQGAAGCSAE